MYFIYSRIIAVSGAFIFVGQVKTKIQMAMVEYQFMSMFIYF